MSACLVHMNVCSFCIQRPTRRGCVFTCVIALRGYTHGRMYFVNVHGCACVCGNTYECVCGNITRIYKRVYRIYTCARMCAHEYMCCVNIHGFACVCENTQTNYTNIRVCVCGNITRICKRVYRIYTCARMCTHRHMYFVNVLRCACVRGNTHIYECVCVEILHVYTREYIEYMHMHGCILVSTYIL